MTEANFLSAIGIPCHHPAHSLWQSLESMFKYQAKSVATLAKVADIMAAQVITLTIDKTLHDAIDAMKKHHIKRLVVIDKDQHLRGIITRSNLVRVLLQKVL